MDKVLPFVASLTFCALVRAANSPAAAPPMPLQAPVHLPDGLELILAAAPPLVNHPILGCLDDRGRLFLGDAAGVNLDKAGLEEKLPNRILMLEDADGDGLYDKATVFADKMTFPQGGCWLAGSLYVASPPGIWKLTDTDGDGVADRREMIVGGFEYTGNAADVHGPFLHPNGRLYWCHGRKGHKIVQKDGTLVHEGEASGIWSCQPDGGDIQWHSLGCMDNPVEVDFTPEGEIVGVANLYYNQPRGDTLIHWLYGGAYERPDQLKVIAGLPRTLEHMPVIHNFGHVTVAGSTFYRSGALNPGWKGNMFVTFFNTQKVVRMELTPAGATYQASEHEFFKLDDPDAHLTDVIEDADGTLLVLDTGGWFRRGCPSSIISKPDFRGAVYRIRKKDHKPVIDPYGLGIPWDKLEPKELTKLLEDERWVVRRKAASLSTGQRPRATDPGALQAGKKPLERLQACQAIAETKRPLDPASRDALLQLLAGPLDPALEHGAMFAAIATGGFDLSCLRNARPPALIRRLLLIIEQTTHAAAVQDALLGIAKEHFNASDAELARTAVAVAARHPRAMELSYDDFNSWLVEKQVTPGTLNAIAAVTAAHLAQPQAQKLITPMLGHRLSAVRQTAWRVLARQPGNVSHPDWFPPLDQSLAEAAANPGVQPAAANVPARAAGGGPVIEADLPLLLDAVAKLRTDHFDQPLQSLSNDARRPQPIRLKALGALSREGQPLSAEAFGLLLRISGDTTSATARVEAARLLARSRPSQDQLLALAPRLESAGPVELLELLKLVRKADAETGRALAERLAHSPVFGAIEESAVRSAFSDLPPEIYEGILAPAVRNAAAANDAKLRRLEELAAVAANGRAREGRQVFENSACVACHKIGSLGRAIGPDLSRIGQIRSARDLLESILFPSATIARDYETRVIETSDGQSFTGIIKSDTAEGLLLVDISGQEKNIPHGQIVANSTMTTSLMLAGLEYTLTEQQLLDLIAWLVSLK